MITTSIVAYLTLFVAVGFLFLFAALLLGRVLRARVATGQKLDIYECGEQSVGSSQVRFDLRFYVVALVFLVFDVEVAFFFPWAVVFGTVTQGMDESVSLAAPANMETATAGEASNGAGSVGGDSVAEEHHQQTMVGDRVASHKPPFPDTRSVGIAPHVLRRLALAAMADIGVFFGVLMVGFAYVWYRGDLDWVRAIGRQPSAGPTP